MPIYSAEDRVGESAWKEQKKGGIERVRVGE